MDKIETKKEFLDRLQEIKTILDDLSDQCLIAQYNWNDHTLTGDTFVDFKIVSFKDSYFFNKLKDGQING